MLAFHSVLVLNVGRCQMQKCEKTVFCNELQSRCLQPKKQSLQLCQL